MMVYCLTAGNRLIDGSIKAAAIVVTEWTGNDVIYRAMIDNCSLSVAATYEVGY